MKKKKSPGMVLGFYVEGFGPFLGTMGVERKFLLGSRISGEGLPKGVRRFDLPGEGGDTYQVTGVGREGSHIVVHLA